jgi:hypothetical protein
MCLVFKQLLLVFLQVLGCSAYIHEELANSFHIFKFNPASMLRGGFWEARLKSWTT